MATKVYTFDEAGGIRFESTRKPGDVRIPNYVYDLWLPLLGVEAIGVYGVYCRLEMHGNVKKITLARLAACCRIGVRKLEEINERLQKCGFIEVFKPSAQERIKHFTTRILVHDAPSAVSPAIIETYKLKSSDYQPLSNWLVQPDEPAPDNQMSTDIQSTDLNANQHLNADNQMLGDISKIESLESIEALEESIEEKILPSASEPANVIPFAEPTTRQALHTAVEVALKLKGSPYGMVEKYVNLLTGQTPEYTTPKGKKKPIHNGDWFTYQVTPGMDEIEIFALHDFIGARYSFLTLGACKVETISRYVSIFRNDKDHDYFVERIKNALPEIHAKLNPQPAPEPEPLQMAAGAEDMSIPVPATREEMKAQGEAIMKALAEKLGGKK